MASLIHKLANQSWAWLLLATAYGLPLTSPLWRLTAVPCTHDGHLHYHRVAAMRYAWEQGVYFTRWLPDLAFGYGYPFFVYREPAPLYMALWPHLLGVPLPAAENLFYALTILACGWFMFLWANDLFGRRAALVAAVAYMSAPYVLIDALVRGNAPESLALPLFPFLLWSGRRWLLGRQSRYLIAGVLGLALLSFGHNISTLIFAPTLLVYLLAVGWINRLPVKAILGRVALLTGLGLGVAFFYTGGALLEMDQVTLQQSTTTRNNDWRYNFASVGEILAPVAAEDPNLINPPLPFRLGWVSLGLALLGSTGLLWLRGQDSTERERRLHILLMILATIGYLFMALPLSRPLWEALPLIDFVQFPWRFVGRAALPVAFLAGVPFSESFVERFAKSLYIAGTRTNADKRGGEHRWVNGAVLLATVLLVAETLPNLYPAYCQEAPYPTITDVHTYERVTGLVGVDPEGSYFPRTVRQRPQGSALEGAYERGRLPQRFDGTVLPEGAAIERVEYQPLSAVVELNTPTPFTARYLSFAFPGWQAEVDGQGVTITPGDPDGLITFPVPAGAHTIAVRWTATPLRIALSGVSGLALLLTVAAAVWFSRRPLASVAPVPLSRSSPSFLVIAFLIAFGLLALKLLVIDRMDNPLRRTGSPVVDQSTALQAGELRLDGYHLSRANVPAGETFDIELAWTAVARPQAEYQSAVSLVGPEGLTWSDKDIARPRIYEDAAPTHFWEPGQWAWDSHEVPVLAGTPPGVYDIVVTLFDLETLQPLTVVDLNGGTVGPTAVVGQLEVTNPVEPPHFTPQYPLPDGGAAVAGLEMRLLGYNQDRTEAIPGDIVLLTLFWEREGEAAASFTLSLLDEAGQSVHSWELPITRPDFPPEQWTADQRLRGQYLVRLPASLADGRYQFLLQDTLPLGELSVTAPERLFSPPPIETPLTADFIEATEPVIQLSGYTLTSVDNSQLTIDNSQLLTLVWQSLAETETSYRVFVHVVDEAGQIVAQSDGEPANWTRPTTSWTAGEYIVDEHILMLPAGVPPEQLSIRVGLYDPDSGQRLLTDGGAADFITLEP